MNSARPMTQASEAFERFAAEIRSRAPQLPENLVLMDTVDSTNRFVKSLAGRFFEEESAPQPALVVAFEQTAGRGRQGRSWVSSAGRGLYCTWLQPLPMAGAGPLDAQLGVLPLLVGVGVCRAIQSFVDARSGLKWPNDVLVDGRKIAGILIETVEGKGGLVAVIGFGVNYDFGYASGVGDFDCAGGPDCASDAGGLDCASGAGDSRRRDLGSNGCCGDVAGGELPTPSATSIALQTGRLPSRASVVEELAASLERELTRAGDPEYTLDAYRLCTVHREGDEVSCRIGGETIAGRFAGFDDGGLFRLETPAGLRAIASGEVIEA